MSDDTNGSLRDKADAAFRRAAITVVKRAKAAGTAVVIWQDGQIKHVPPEAFDTSAWEVEPPKSPS